MSVGESPAIRSVTNLVAAVGWLCLFLYSTYILLEKILTKNEYTVLHVIAPIALMLVTIKAFRRYVSAKKK